MAGYDLPYRTWRVQRGNASLIGMKSLAASNRYLQAPEARKAAVDRNVRSSSAIEGVSAKVFHSAAKGRFVAATERVSRAIVVKDSRPKK